MKRLKNVIEKYGRWSELTIYTERIEAHMAVDFSHAIENAKALLETIGKEVCKSKGIEVDAAASINSVMKKAFIAIGYSSDNMVTQISSALATIGQNIGNLRNEISPTSHGKSLEELKQRNNNVVPCNNYSFVYFFYVVGVLHTNQRGRHVPTLPSYID